MDALSDGFLEKYQALPLVVFYQDEARFGRISNEVACWVDKADAPIVTKQLVREYIYSYSALSPQTGDCFSIITSFCNTEIMSTFLEELGKQYSQYRIVMLLDKAGWHTSQLLNVPENIKLMHLCPYSPELNPVELLWREIRAKYFHNETFESLDKVADTLEIALKKFYEDKQAIKTLAKGFIIN
ncbi:uncharacterized protein y4pE/y4sA [Filimonas sp.]|nr:uncharacterized protein y4pE/y4sA [Filimonas sp.]GBL35762.1 uncharacterized protein y4pE/y4sA [Filimonas sp.]